MGKTFRRDSNWDKNKERDLRKHRDIEKAARRAAMEPEDETDSDFGETNNGFWEKRDRPARR